MGADDGPAASCPRRCRRLALLLGSAGVLGARRPSPPRRSRWAYPPRPRSRSLDTPAAASRSSPSPRASTAASGYPAGVRVSPDPVRLEWTRRRLPLHDVLGVGGGDVGLHRRRQQLRRGLERSDQSHPGLDVLDAGGDHLYNQLSAVNVPPQNCTPGNTTYCTYRAYFVVAAPGQPTQVAVSQSGDSLVGDLGRTGERWAGVVAHCHGRPRRGRLTADLERGRRRDVRRHRRGRRRHDLFGHRRRHERGGRRTGLRRRQLHHRGGEHRAVRADRTQSRRGSPAVPTCTPPGPRQRPETARSTTTRSRSAGTTRPGPPNDRDAGTATTFDSPDFNKNFDWAVQVRAHNAAGWGAWSSSVILHAF